MIGPRGRSIHVLILLGLAGLLLFVDLGGVGLTDRDEGSNAEAAREMFESGNWISPTLNGEPRFAKPALLYWLIAGSYHLFGVREFSARLPSAAFGVLLILLQYAFLARVLGSTVGLFGAVMLLVNLEMVVIGRLVLTDSVMVFFTTLAMVGFWLGLHHSRRWMWWFYVGMALATLTKGPVGVAVPLLAAIPYLTVARRWGQFWRRGVPLTGTLVFLLLAVPWYAAMLALHGSRYTASAQADTVGRFLATVGGHGGTILFYVPVLLLGFFPWSAFLPVALWGALARWREVRSAPRDSEGPAPDADLEFFAALGLVCVFVFFSLSATRLPHYLLPLFPLAATVTAVWWGRCVGEGRCPGVRGAFRTMVMLGYVLGIGLAVMPGLYRRFVDRITPDFPVADQIDPGIGPILASLVLLAGMSVVGYLGRSPRRRPAAFWAAGLVMALVILVGLKITLPRFHHFFIDPPQRLAHVAGTHLGPEDRLIAYGPPKPSYVFYARRRVIMIRPGEEPMMTAALDHRGASIILLPSRLRPSLPREAAAYPVILERYGYVLLGSPPVAATMKRKAPPAHGAGLTSAPLRDCRSRTPMRSAVPPVVSMARLRAFAVTGEFPYSVLDGADCPTKTRTAMSTTSQAPVVSARPMPMIAPVDGSAAVARPPETESQRRLSPRATAMTPTQRVRAS